MFRNEYSEPGLLLLLERQRRFDIHIPAAPVQCRHYPDTRLPRDPTALAITGPVQEIYVGLVLHAMADVGQHSPQLWISRGTDLFV